MMQSLTHFFSQPIQVQLISVVFYCYPLLAVFFLVAPLFAAFTRTPLPTGEWFPDRREKIALAWAVFLLPLASFIIVGPFAYFDYILFALLNVSLCVFLTAIAGRRPFLYSLLVSLLYLASWAACHAMLNGPDRWERVNSESVGVVIRLILGGDLITGLCLFLLWRCMDRNPDVWQAAPSE